MIPEFPLFTKLSSETKAEYSMVTKLYEPYSDFNYTSLYCWSDDSVDVSRLNDNLVVVMPDYISNKRIYTLLGSNNIDKTFIEIKEYMIKNSIEPVLSLVPQIVIDNIKSGDDFEIKEDRDNYDYIYKLNSLVYLEGSEFQQKRNYIRKFDKNHSDRLKIVDTNFRIQKAKDMVIQIFNDWQTTALREETDTINELKAIKKLLDNIDDFAILGSIILVDNKPSAFVMNEIINEEYSILHFEKAVNSHDKLALFLKHHSSMLLQESCKFINYEQDLGIAGLRQAKMSYHPVKFLKKYTVTLKID